MPPVTFRILLPFDDNTLPVVFVPKLTEYTIVTSSDGEYCEIYGTDAKSLHIVVVELHAPLAEVATPTCADVGWEWIG